MFARYVTKVTIRVIYVLGIVLATENSTVARELIENGSFEADGLFPIDPRTGWDDGPGLGNDVGFAVDRYPVDDLTGEPLIGPLRPLGTGDVMGRSWGAANGDGHRGSATQFVDLSGFMGQPFEFSAWLAASSRPDDNDYAIVSLEFFTGDLATGMSLASFVLDGNNQESPFIVGSANAEGLPDPSIPATQDNWTFYRASGIIPNEALSGAVLIRGAVPEGDIGFGNDALVDLVSLQAIPEPASILLLVTVLPVALLWRRLHRGRHEVAGSGLRI